MGNTFKGNNIKNHSNQIKATNKNSFDSFIHISVDLSKKKFANRLDMHASEKQQHFRPPWPNMRYLGEKK